MTVTDNIVDYISTLERRRVKDLYSGSAEELEINHDEITSREENWTGEFQDEVADEGTEGVGKFQDKIANEGAEGVGDFQDEIANEGVEGIGEFQGEIAKKGAEGMEEDQDEVANEEDQDIEEDPEVIARRGGENPKSIARKMAKELRASHAKMLRCFGEIPGVPVGSTWGTRKECYLSGVHRSMQAGIQGTKVSGACSIVVSGQYEGDKDLGDTILYVGAGGGLDNGGWPVSCFLSPKRPGPQVSNQEWTGWGNEALRRSYATGKPVRVVRSWKFVSHFAPRSGYRYDGLYTVTHAYRKMDEAGHFYICHYNLERIPGQPPLPRRNRYDIEMSRYSPASVVTSDTVVLPSEASTSHKRKAYFEDDPLIHADTRYVRRKLSHQLALDSDSDDEEGQDEDLGSSCSPYTLSSLSLRASHS
ncbi:hypothetical protein BDR04DRAFT_1093358 [Suillus decipiens]|nr:hypothetical protein BDR04DRAFT_1093358 [Suillus decipiens]